MQLELESGCSHCAYAVVLYEQLALASEVARHDAMRLPDDIGSGSARPALHHHREREIRLLHEPSNIPRLL